MQEVRYLFLDGTVFKDTALYLHRTWRCHKVNNVPPGLFDAVLPRLMGPQPADSSELLTTLVTRHHLAVLPVHLNTQGSE